MGTSVTLEFEKPIVELEKQIDELKRLAGGQQLDVDEEIAPLEKKLADLREEIYKNLTPWQRVQVARSTKRLRRRLAAIAPITSATLSAPSAPAIDAREGLGDREVVVIVNVVSIVPAPGASDGGLKLQPVPVGRLLHPRVTAFENTPPCAASVMRNVAVCPAATVNDPGDAVTPKFVTVTCIGVVSENETPLLLAPTLTLVVPNGHVIVEPGLEPQPPVQVRRVIGH